MVNRKPAVFLDRDGVINRSILVNGTPTAPNRYEDIEILPNVQESIARLTLSNYHVVVITNQPDVERGLISKNQINAINSAICDLVGIKYSYICYHDDSNKCNCRKPKPGNIFKAAFDLKIDLKKSFMIGDRWRDIDAGQKAGCKCFFIDYKYPDIAPKMPYIEVKSLTEAFNLIVPGE